MSAATDALRARALALGLVGLGACAIGAAYDVDRFFHAYLVAYVFWLGLSLGCLAIVMIHHVTGGAWGLAIRRLLEAGTRTIPAMALLFVPVVLGMRSLYPWSRPDVLAADELVRHKQAYLNPTFFLARAVLYFCLWSVLAWRLNLMSRQQDRTGDEGIIRRYVLLSSGGLLVFVLTMTFASVDWVMSLEPRWSSTIYGPLLMSGFAVSAFCFVIAIALMMGRSNDSEISRVLTPEIAHDLGKLLFAFVMVWAYFALSQFLIIWSVNLPEEIPWYMSRLSGGWQWVGLAIILLHFALPFGLLLMRRIKRDAGRLLRVASLLLVMRFVDTWWMIAPAFGGHSIAEHWMDLAAAVGVGGIWVRLFLWHLAQRPLLPARDPFLREMLSHDAR